MATPPTSTTARPTSRRGRFVVYVGDVLDDTGIPIGLYVGQTAKSAADRWAEHAAGIRAARVFRRADRYPGQLRRDLCPNLRPLRTRAAAKAAEVATADKLRGAGHRIYGGH